MSPHPRAKPHRPDARAGIRLRALRLPEFDDGSELPVDADPPERRRGSAPLAAAVTRIMQRLRLTDTDWIEGLRHAWPEIAGPELAAIVRPGKEDGGVLYLYVGNSAQLFELRRYRLPALEKRIRQHPGADRLRQVRLKLDPTPP